MLTYSCRHCQRSSISSLKSISVIRYDQARFFIEAIRQDKLRIRKTHDPNHAKLYIFKIKDEIANLKSSFFITCSSKEQDITGKKVL